MNRLTEKLPPCTANEVKAVRRRHNFGFQRAAACFCIWTGTSAPVARGTLHIYRCAMSMPTFRHQEFDHGHKPMQAQMETVDMLPENSGIWVFRCHIDGQMDAGMVALYKVDP